MGIRVFLADDHAVVRDGLRMLLEAHEDLNVVGEAANGRQCVKKVEKLMPDVVVMDIAMPGMNGVEATRSIRDVCPETRVLILSMYATHEHIFRALRAGAKGYVVKESAGKEVVDAVRSVYAGSRYLSQQIVETVVDAYIMQRGIEEPQNPLDRLSPREREILQLVVEGKSSVEIGEILYLSAKTVETYRSRMMKKLGIGDIPGLVKFALKEGVIPAE